MADSQRKAWIFMQSEKREKIEDGLLAAPRGTRDFLFEEKIMREEIISVLKNAFELYGFNPMETPAFERWEVLASKYAGGDEILKETYRFQDQGERELGLRYDFTVPLCRVVAANPALSLPFKRYVVGSVWRDGPVKLGRYRECVQCDADTIGAKSGLADAELIGLACDVFQTLGIEFVVRVNNRKLLEGLLQAIGVEEAKVDDVILSVDKLQKIGGQGVEKELIEKGVSIPVARKLLSTLDELNGSFEEVFATCERLLVDSEQGKRGLTELEEVFDFLQGMNRTSNVVADVSLARGLAYYTGTVFEAYAKGSGINSSIAAGGRYDELIGRFSGKENVPAVGISFGLDVLAEVVKLGGSKAQRRSVAVVFVIPIKTIPQCIAITNKLRENGIATGMDLVGRSISKNLEYAAKQGVKYALIVGPKEAQQNKATLRNLETGEEQLLDVAEQIVSKLKLVKW
ncbi:histidine--tRNA ligase [Candidatus Micrarchaeota archaeon]|nr:histidine--tRNA ligase [Candidatus Micrarchaeota archaeon]